MSDVDLEGLRIDTPTPTTRRHPVGPRRFGIALGLVAIAVIATFVWPLLRPVRAVATAPIRLVTTRDAAATAAVAEAAGWIEPDPYPVLVRPLVDGVVATLDVLEGDRVVAGETTIATLDSAALRAAVDRAAALVAERETELALVRERAAGARARLTQNAAARSHLALQRSAAAITATRLATVSARLAEAEAAVAGADAALRAQRALAERGGSNEIARARAAAAADAARAVVEAGRAERDGLGAELDAIRAAVGLAEELAADPVDLSSAARVAEQEVEHFAARLAMAREERAIARRELDWATVRAPIDGVVMRLETQPGGHVGPRGGAVVALYDPGELRARIDVPLESVGPIEVGRPVELRSAALGDTVIAGVVQRVLHAADLLKNTLQVHVGIADPPPGLRPEMLCRARFLGTATDAEPAARAAFRVPAAAVRDGAVQILDVGTGTARRVAIEVLGEDAGDAVVAGELSVTQRVILTPVAAGTAVRDQEERR